MNTPKLPPLPQLFRDAMDWDRSYGTRLNNTPEMLDEVASQFADKATAAIAAQGVPDGWTEDQIAQAAMEAEIPDAKLESLLIALASAPPAPQAGPDRTGMTYYKKDGCKAPSADHPDCICWTPAPQSGGFDPGWPFQVPQAAVVQQEDNWRKYATEREDTAQAVIERHRKEHESLLRLLAKDRQTIAELKAAHGIKE